MPWDLTDRLRDEDGFTLWTAEVSRAIASGAYERAVAILVESGRTHRDAERFVAVTVAAQETRPVTNGSVRLGVLVEIARNAMRVEGWSFRTVSAAVSEAQLVEG